MPKSIQTFSCWKCNKKYPYNEDRVQHFIACHFALLPSADKAFTAYLKNHSTPLLNQKGSSKVIPINTLRELFKCWECKKELQSQNGRLYHFVQKHARTILCIDIDPSSSLRKQIEIAQERMSTTTNDTTVSEKSMLSPTTKLSTWPFYETEARQEQMKSIGKSISCSQCHKKFLSTSKFKKHVHAKHSRTIFGTTTSKIKALPDRTTLLKKQLKFVQYTNSNAHNPFSCSQYPEQIETTANSDVHSTGNDIESVASPHSLPSIPFIYTTPTLSYQTKNIEEMSNSVNLSFQKCSNCAEIFESTTDRDINLKAKHIQFNSPTSAMATDHVKTMKHNNDCINTFSCWQCSKKFKTVHSRWSHFIDHHILSTLSISDIRLSHVDNSTASRHKTSDDVVVSNTLLPKQFRCWSCTKKFQSDQSFLTHFADKHANFILSVPTDPIYILKNEIIKAKQQMKMSSTQDLKNLKSVNTYGMNFQSKHIETVSTQYEKKATEHVIESINPQHYQASCAQTLELYTNAKSSNNVSEHARHCFKRFSCWKCFEKYKSALGRLYHFISSHSELFLPTTIVSSKPMMNSLNNTRFCWECAKKLKSHRRQIFHFIDNHAKMILSMDTDPSDILKNQIAKAQERMKIEQALFSCSQCLKTFKVITDLSNHINSKHTKSIRTFTSKISKYIDSEAKQTQEQIKTIKDVTFSVDTSFNNSKCSMEFGVGDNCSNHLNIEHLDFMYPSNFDSQVEVFQEHANSRLPKETFIHISYYCQQCQKEFICADDHLEHFQNQHTQVKLSSKTLEEFFTDPAIMQCPKANSTTIVYMLLEATRKQISITFDKMNRCPYQACQLEAANYDFKEFWLHTIKEHTNAQIKLECCDPMMMYTLEEYRKHIQTFD